jgi:hypothetical protein
MREQQRGRRRPRPPGPLSTGAARPPGDLVPHQLSVGSGARTATGSGARSPTRPGAPVVARHAPVDPSDDAVVLPEPAGRDGRSSTAGSDGRGSTDGASDPDAGAELELGVHGLDVRERE